MAREFPFYSVADKGALATLRDSLRAAVGVPPAGPARHAAEEVGLAEYIDLLTALDDLSEAGSPGGRSAEQTAWLERLSAYALVKNTEQPQDRAPVSPPAAGGDIGP